MKTLYVFDFAQGAQNTDLLIKLLTLAGHNTTTLSELSGSSELETGMEGAVSEICSDSPSVLFNPKEILLVGCRRPEKLSSRFTVREIDYPEVLKVLSHFSWPLKLTAEKIIAELMGLELPRIYEILTGEVEGM